MTMHPRREFLRRLGVSAAALPFLGGLPSLRADGGSRARQRVVFMFTPNGTVPPAFWPDETGDEFTLKPILEPLAPFKDRLLVLKGMSNRVRGDGDSHMRGMSCLLTGKELFPGNIQGGSDTPAGWASGISIDQELKNFLQAEEATRTRFGSLELGVAVPDRADPWTRWSYAGPNQPVAPIDDPYKVLGKLYGRMKDRETLGSILDDVLDDIRTVASRISSDDRSLLDQHLAFVREMEIDLQRDADETLDHPAPELDPDVEMKNDNIPRITAMQTDLLVNAFANDLARVGSIQFTNSVGQARMKWLGIEEGHHSLSHDPDLNADSQDKLTRINTWFCEQLAALAGKLAAMPEPGGEGTMLDHTTIVWTNELGKGNSHSLDEIPFVLVGGGLGFRTGRSLNLGGAAHNRLWLAFAHAMGHGIEAFGNPALCEGGPLDLA